MKIKLKEDLVKEIKEYFYKKIEENLSFYADSSNYQNHAYEDEQENIPIKEDKGNQAQESLRFVKVLNILDNEVYSKKDLEFIRSQFYNDGLVLCRKLEKVLYG